MVYGAITGNRNLQRFLKDRYNQLHDSGLSKKEAHAAAFQETLAAKEEGYIPEELLEEEPEPEEEQDYYKDIIYSEKGGF